MIGKIIRAKSSHQSAAAGASQLGAAPDLEILREGLPIDVDDAVVVAVGGVALSVPAPRIVEPDAPFTLLLIDIEDSVGVVADNAVALDDVVAVLILAEVAGGGRHDVAVAEGIAHLGRQRIVRLTDGGRISIAEDDRVHGPFG